MKITHWIVTGALLAMGLACVACASDVVADTKFSHDRGFYEAPFDVIVLNQIKSAGLYPDLIPPDFKLRDSQNLTRLTLNMANLNSSGSIYFTTDGTDPRQSFTGNPVGTLYTRSITLTESTRVKARVLSGVTWSPLNEATFSVGPVAENLRITEIMYHPLDTGEPDDPNREFIELKNVGLVTLNLNLVSFTNGISFMFPSMELAPDEYVLVVKDIDAFIDLYGADATIAGEYSGRLNNGGERIVLKDAAGLVIQDFSYKDNWYDSTDGEGFSLTIEDPTGFDANQWGRKSGWRPSVNPGGSPGWDDAGDVPLGEAVNNLPARTVIETLD